MLWCWYVCDLEQTRCCSIIFICVLLNLKTRLLSEMVHYINKFYCQNGWRILLYAVLFVLPIMLQLHLVLLNHSCKAVHTWVVTSWRLSYVIMIWWTIEKQKNLTITHSTLYMKIVMDTGLLASFYIAYIHAS